VVMAHMATVVTRVMVVGVVRTVVLRMATVLL